MKLAELLLTEEIDVRTEPRVPCAEIGYNSTLLLVLPVLSVHAGDAGISKRERSGAGCFLFGIHQPSISIKLTRVATTDDRHGWGRRSIHLALTSTLALPSMAGI